MSDGIVFIPILTLDNSLHPPHHESPTFSPKIPSQAQQTSAARHMPEPTDPRTSPHFAEWGAQQSTSPTAPVLSPVLEGACQEGAAPSHSHAHTRVRAHTYTPGTRMGLENPRPGRSAPRGPDSQGGLLLLSPTGATWRQQDDVTRAKETHRLPGEAAVQETHRLPGEVAAQAHGGQARPTGPSAANSLLRLADGGLGPPPSDPPALLPSTKPVRSPGDSDPATATALRKGENRPNWPDEIPALSLPTLARPPRLPWGPALRTRPPIPDGPSIPGSGCLAAPHPEPRSRRSHLCGAWPLISGGETEASSCSVSGEGGRSL